MSIKVHRFMADMRAQGRPWNDINSGLSAQQQQWQNDGLGMWQIFDRLGYTNASILRDDLEQEAMKMGARGG